MTQESPENPRLNTICSTAINTFLKFLTMFTKATTKMLPKSTGHIIKKDSENVRGNGSFPYKYASQT